MTAITIPPDRQDALRAALQTSFGVGQPDALTPLMGGLSGALVYRMIIAGQPWLLRIETAAPSAFADPHRHYTSLQRAAAVGVAPAVRFADPAARIAIMAYVEPRPLAGYPGGAPAAALELAGLVARLQTTPVFGQLTDYLDGVDGIIANLMGLGVVTEAAIAPYLAAYRTVRDAYPRPSPAQRVSSHNDINPNNVLYDGRRLWLVDWEAAFANDPHVDPATIANWYGLDAETEEALLRTVFGDVDEAVRARHFLMRQVVRTFVACMMLTVSGMSGGLDEPVADLSGVDLAMVQQGLRSGALNVGENAGRIALAKANLNAVLETVRGPAFAMMTRKLAA